MFKKNWLVRNWEESHLRSDNFCFICSCLMCCESLKRVVATKELVYTIREHRNRETSYTLTRGAGWNSSPTRRFLQHRIEVLASTSAGLTMWGGGWYTFCGGFLPREWKMEIHTNMQENTAYYNKQENTVCNDKQSLHRSTTYQKKIKYIVKHRPYKFSRANKK